MAENIQIILEAIDKASGAIKSTTKSLGGLDSGLSDTIQSMTGFNMASISIAGGVTLVGTAIKKSIDDTLEYAQVVEDFSQLTGESAENTSRLIQLSEELQISQKDLSSAMESANKKGVNTSIAGLMMLSDKYLFLEKTIDRNKFLLDNFGASGLEMADMMELGAAGILKMVNAVEENKTMTEDGIQAAKDYKKAIKDLTTEFDGLSYSVGNKVIPILERNLSGINSYIEAIQIAAEKGNIYGTMWEFVNLRIKDNARRTEEAATAIYDYTDRTKDAEAAAKILTAQIKEQTEANKGLLGLITSVKNENDNYTKKSGELILKQNELTGELNNLMANGWSPMSSKVQDVTTKLAENKQAMSELEAEHDRALSMMVYNLYIAKLQADGFTDAEFEMALQAGLTAGVLDEKSVDMARAMNDTANAAIGAKGEVDNLKSSVDRLADKTITITTRYVSDGGRTVGHEDTGIGGYANGANFIVPPGYPNDSFPMRVQSGEHVQVTPAGKSGKSGGFGSGVTIVYSPMISLASQSEIDNVLLPLVRKAMRNA